MNKYFVLALVLLPSLAFADISFVDNEGFAQGNSSSPSLSITTTGDLLVCTLLAEANGTTASDVEFDSAPMTQLGTTVDIDDGSQHQSVWYIIPSTTSGSFTATLSGSTPWAVGCVSYLGVDQTTPFDTSSQGSGVLGTPLDVERTSTQDGSWHFVSLNSGSTGTSVSSPASLRQAITSGTCCYMADSNASVANTVLSTIEVVWVGGAQRIGYITAMILPETSGGSTSTPEVSDLYQVTDDVSSLLITALFCAFATYIMLFVWRIFISNRW